MLTLVIDGKEEQFDIQEYHGQDYDATKWALTVVTIEDTYEVYLVPIYYRFHMPEGKLAIENLCTYLKRTETVWTKIHTVFKHQYCDFTSK